MENSLKNILKCYKKFPQVKAIALGGSTYAKNADEASDIDIYIFSKNDIPVKDRENIIKKISSKYEVGAEYFGSGDEFLVDKINIVFDMMYWNVKWFEDIVENVWIKHCPSNGYTTCFLYTLDICKIVYDPDNWLQGLKDRINTDYPEELQKNIIKRNMALMVDKPFASYYEQIEKAINRNDVNSINHRLAAFMASYFDIIFAKNKLLHIGEKRLVKYTKDNCKILPRDFEENINKLFIQSNADTLIVLNNMVEQLREII